MSSMDEECMEATATNPDMRQEAIADVSGTTEAMNLLHQHLQQAELSIVEHQKEIRHLRSQNQQLLKLKHDALNDARHWRTKYEGKAADLTEAKNALFDAQGPDPIPDSQIAEQWNKLCRNVEQWVDDHIQPDCNHFHNQIKQFLESKNVHKAMKDRIPDYWDERRNEATQQGNDRFEQLVCLVIHANLRRFIFSKDLPMIGIYAQTSALIYQIEELLQTLTPPKDHTKRAQWRSEALEALCASADYNRLKQEAVANIVLEAKDTLGHLFLKDQDRALLRFAHDIVEPAISFDRILRQSTTNYFFLSEVYSTQHSRGNGQSLFLDCFEIASVIDIETGKKVTLKDEIRMSDPKPIGQKALVVVPALCCQRGKMSFVLVKQVLLAEMDVLRVRHKLKAASLTVRNAEQA